MPGFKKARVSSPELISRTIRHFGRGLRRICATGVFAHKHEPSASIIEMLGYVAIAIVYDNFQIRLVVRLVGGLWDVGEVDDVTASNLANDSVVIDVVRVCNRGINVHEVWALAISRIGRIVAAA